MAKNMSKRSNPNRHLVSLVLYKNKWVYYDLEDKKLYFSISKRPSKNQQLYSVGITLLSLPLVRLLNDSTIFSIPTIKYSCLILCSCLSLLIGKLVVDYYNKDLDVFPELFTDSEYLEFSQAAKKKCIIGFLVYLCHLSYYSSILSGLPYLLSILRIADLFYFLICSFYLFSK